MQNEKVLISVMQQGQRYRVQQLILRLCFSNYVKGEVSSFHPLSKFVRSESAEETCLFNLSFHDNCFYFSQNLMTVVKVFHLLLHFCRDRNTNKRSCRRLSCKSRHRGALLCCHQIDVPDGDEALFSLINSARMRLAMMKYVSSSGFQNTESPGLESSLMQPVVYLALWVCAESKRVSA